MSAFLKCREKELWDRIRPINDRLTEIDEQKAKLADEWVSSNMKPGRFEELKRSLDKEEARLKSIRTQNDPAQLEELESTRSSLPFWQNQLQSMAWNTETEDYRMIRLIDKPHETALQVIGLEDKNISKSLHFPATKRELLDKLQVRVLVFRDRIEVKALFSIEPIYSRKCTSPYQEGDTGIGLPNKNIKDENETRSSD